jgi:parallel beta-helix repeat protein
MNPIQVKAERGERREAQAGRRRRMLPAVMALEDRALLSTLTVSNTDDTGSGSLRAAVAQANTDGGGDTIAFSSLFNTPQTITLLSGELELTGSSTTTINGPGANLLTINGGQGEYRVFEVAAAATAAMSGVTITGGSADYGGGVANSGTLTLTNVTISGNRANNVSGASGGAGLAAVAGATTTLVGCTITGNIGGGNINASSGAGIFNGGFSTLTMTDCLVSGNTASGEGGGVYTDGTTTLTGCTISNNSSGTFGGGMANNGLTTLTNCTVSGNSASSGGGGLANYDELTVTGCTIGGNAAGSGGGLFNSQDNVITVSDSTLSGNTVSGSGGGAYNPSGTLALSNCTIADNSAGGNGAGLANGSPSGPPVLAITRSNSGAGSFSAQDQGPAMSLMNCTITGNTAYAGAGGVASYGMLSMTNTIVAGNTGGDLTGTSTGGSNLVGGNALLSALSDFGGPTATMALLPGSPAIGGGTRTGAPALDQRGEPRSGHVDIGAFQSQGFALTPVAASNSQSTPINQPFPNPVAFTVTANNSVEPVNGGIVSFATASSGGASATLSSGTATIAGGVASVTATANSAIGKYGLSATAAGAGAGGIVLTNVEQPSLVVTTNQDNMNNTDGLTSLREAITYAESLAGPSTITFDPAFFSTKRRTIRLTGGPLVISHPATITIAGPGALRLTIGGGGKSGVFDIEGGSLALSGLKVAGGVAQLGGGLKNDAGTLALTRVRVQGNRAIVGGGLFNAGRTTMRRVIIGGNVARVGSGIFNMRGARLAIR